MTEPTTKSLLDYGSLDDEVARLLEVDNEAGRSMQSESSTEQVNVHLELVKLFVNHNVDEKPQATARLMKKLATADEREKNKRKHEEEHGEKRAMLEQLFELYGQTIPKADIKKLLRENNYDLDSVLDELARATLVEPADIFEPKSNIVKNVYSPQAPIVFNNDEFKSNSPVRKKPAQSVSLEEAISIANKKAEEYRRQSDLHKKQAHQFGRKDLRFGALTALARDEKKKAEQSEHKADELVASDVKDSIDLHLMPVERALHFVLLSIMSVRKRRPWQRTLDVITGRGLNNPTGKPVLKMAVQQFLDKMEIKYECPTENPGVLYVKL